MGRSDGHSYPNNSDVLYLVNDKKYIIKVYSKNFFSIWMKVFKLDWRKYGFDYVPVEPVLRYFDSVKANKIVENLNLDENEIYYLKGDQLLVYTKIVGISVADFIHFYPHEYIDEKERIHNFANKINNILLMNGINHNDIAYRNICINVETRKLFLIDFGISKFLKDN